jgi:hypothetical protein
MKLQLSQIYVNVKKINNSQRGQRFSKRSKSKHRGIRKRKSSALFLQFVLVRKSKITLVTLETSLEYQELGRNKKVKPTTETEHFKTMQELKKPISLQLIYRNIFLFHLFRLCRIF